MPRLIINADDLGINMQRTHGIFQAFEFGMVRSASLLSNCSDSLTAARHARERGLTCGLHLNFTEGYPISKPQDIGTLLNAQGQFYAFETLTRLFTENEVDPVHIEREARAQLEWIQEHYGQPSHIDGHHHIHVYPQVTPVIIPILERYGIGCVRLPLEEPLPPFGYNVPEERMERVVKNNALAREAKVLFDAHGLIYTDHFRGATMVGNASMKNLRHVLSRLPEGTCEFMCHPGSQVTIGDAFSLDPQRQTELAMLLHEELPGLLKERKIEVITYFDLLG